MVCASGYKNLMYPIFSISGFPGSGKSTLCRQLQAQYNISYVAYDDFETLTSRNALELRRWIDTGMPLEELRNAAFSDKVISSAQKGPVIIESPLGPLHKSEGMSVEISIWLDVSLDLALGRAIQNIISDEWASVSQLQEWFSEYREAYEVFVRRSLLLQRYQVGDKCDILIDASGSADQVFLKAKSIFDDIDC